VDATNLLRLLVPNVAQFWETLYNGTVAAGVHQLVLLLSVLLVAIGFALLVSELALLGDWRAASGKLIRFVIAVFVIVNAGLLNGQAPLNRDRQPGPSQALLWQIYHSLYVAIYENRKQGEREIKGFYYTWLYGEDGKGPIPQAIGKLNQALETLALKRAQYEALDAVVNDGLLRSLKVSCKAREVLPVPMPVLSEIAIATLCRANELVKEATKTAKDAYARATMNLFIALLFLLGVHAAIIYGSVIFTYAVTFFAPLAAALYLFRSTERAFPTLLGYTLAAYLVLVLSAVGFGAASVVLFNTVAARVQNALPTDNELKEIQAQVERLNRVSERINRQVGTEITRIQANISILRELLYNSVSCSPNGTCTTNVSLPRDIPEYTVYIVTKNEDGSFSVTTQRGRCAFSNTTAFRGGTTVDVREVRACIATLERAKKANEEALEVVPNTLAGLLTKLADRVTGFIRDVLFTFTLLTGAAVVLGAVLGLSMFWLIATVGRVLGGQISVGQGIGGRPPV
jgi:hypothetical protein